MQSPYPSVFPAQLGAQPLSPAQQRYLHYISQAATRLAASIKKVRQRQQHWA
ncbi:MAG: hypothetical protein KME07_05545 [Pegethrix bostrychoides GSE-TBD4-15B]|uniref:Uncharacterized protein n=1 Tax=Pegethrix bostrychoides GSE-TBD4-15B TaxID=2839662 RepID=A0A951P889_9CYAN|nr:hypothetical protein [Pegethrix bostrychoides GSE-TBD4-15B]